MRRVSSEVRQISLAGAWQGYCLKRSSVRHTLALSIREGGLQVHAPWHMPLSQIETFIGAKAHWVTQKLALCPQMAPPDWQDGMVLRWLGQLLTLRLDASVVRVRHEESVLRVPLRDSARVRSAVLAWYRKQALPLFAQRMERFMPLLPRPPVQLLLSSARTRWGSCTSGGVVRLNWRLLQASMEEIDYVLAHELAHLTHLNHSGQFWCELARLLPDYDRGRRTLRLQGTGYQQISRQ